MPLSDTSTSGPAPRDLRGAAAVARTLGYAAALVGAVVGVLLWRQGDGDLALAVWVLTLCVGALLMVSAFLLEGITALLARMAALESDVRVLLGHGGGHGPSGSVEQPPNPWHRDEP